MQESIEFPEGPLFNNKPTLGGKWGDHFRETKNASAHREYLKALTDNDDFKLLSVPEKEKVIRAAKQTILEVEVSNGHIMPEQYVSLVEKGPIVTVDLVIFDHIGRVLVGKRNNEPAKNTLFVPGARIRKHEDMKKAIERITDAELGTYIDPNKFSLLGVYQHIYPNNFKNDDFGTHVICFAYAITLDKPLVVTSDNQHESFKWLEPKEIENNAAVHQYVKNYFHPCPWNKIC